MTMNPTGLREETSTPAPTGREREVMRDLLQELQGRIDLIPPDVLGFSTATVRDAFQRYHDRMAAKYALTDTDEEDTTALDDGLTWRLREFLLSYYQDADDPVIRRALRSLNLTTLREFLYGPGLVAFREMIQNGDARALEFLQDVIALYGVTVAGEWASEDLAVMFFGLEFAHNFCLPTEANVSPADKVGGITNFNWCGEPGNSRFPSDPCASLVSSLVNLLWPLPDRATAAGTGNVQDMLRQVTSRLFSHPLPLITDEDSIMWKNLRPGATLAHLQGVGIYSHVVVVVGWGERRRPWNGTAPDLYSTYQEAEAAGVSAPIPYVIDRGYMGQEGGTQWRGPRPYDEYGGRYTTLGFNATLISPLPVPGRCIGYPTQESPRLRESPDREGRILATLSRAEALEVLGRSTDRRWYKVRRVANGEEGWVWDEYIQFVDQTQGSPCRFD